MPNTIKISSTGDTLSLKKGDFYIGVGDVPKGPTSETDHWNGITPSSGAYTIYQSKLANGPSIRVASDDSTLIDYSERLYGGSNINNVYDALNYLNSQPGILCVNRDYESITSNGLLVCIDAGYSPSYPTSGTTIKDLSYNNNNGELSNGPTFDSNNGGSISFNASLDQSININSAASILSTVNYTKIAWFYCTNFVSFNNNIISGGNTGQHAFWLFNSNKLNAGHNGAWNTVVGTTTLSLNTWYCGAVTFNTTTGWRLYLNGVLEDTDSSTTTFTGTGDIQVARYQGGNNFSGRIAIAQVYNRVLSDAEILQNFNAQKSRFGL